MFYVFDMATDQGRILEQAGSDIENSNIEDIIYDCMTLILLTHKFYCFQFILY